MIEATTNPALRRAAHEAHIQRSLVAWAMVAAIRNLPARLLPRNWKRAARLDGPSMNLRCAA